MSALGRVLRCGKTRLKLCSLPQAPKRQTESRPFPSGTETQGGSSRCQVLIGRLPLRLQVLHGCPLKYRHLACGFSPANLTMQRGLPPLCRLDSFASCWTCTEKVFPYLPAVELSSNDIWLCIWTCLYCFSGGCERRGPSISRAG